MEDEKFKYILNEYLHSKIEKINLTSNQKYILLAEMQTNIELEIAEALERANKFANGEIPKYGILI